jgi:hypothetical protein
MEEQANTPGMASTMLAAVAPPATPAGMVAMTLPLPPGMPGKKPDSFYEQVAVFVALCRQNGVAVGPRLAADNGVPVATVHRWIREARRRGVMKEDS